MAKGKRTELRFNATQTQKFMKMALRLASSGRRKTSPNPMVGAVVVNGGKVVGTGSHQYAGGPHAEIVAIKRAGKLARGGVIFLNLEPCSHYGRTPPCVFKIVESGVTAVFASMVDPDPRVSGKGFDFLRRHGVKVKVGVLEKEAKRLNEAYIKWVTEARPFVAVKVCESIDGRIASSGGESRGLGSEEEIKFAHSLRTMYDAVLVGVGTVLSDDPELTVRKVKGLNPHKIILDSGLRTPLSSAVLRHGKGENVILASVKGASKAKVDALRARGVEVWTLPSRNKKIDLNSLLSKAADHSIQSILVEGGSDVVTSFLRAGLVDKIYIAIAPKILGGTGNCWPKEVGVRRIDEAIRLARVEVKRLGTDVLIEGYL